MKTNSKRKDTMIMSYSAFQSHAYRQATKVRQVIAGCNGGASNERVRMAFLQNPLALVTTLGFLSTMTEEESCFFMATATTQFSKLYGKFANLDSMRYMVVVKFLDSFCSELAQKPSEAQVYIHACYEWLYDQDADISSELKDQLNGCLNAIQINEEADYIDENLPSIEFSSQQKSAFKI